MFGGDLFMSITIEEIAAQIRSEVFGAFRAILVEHFRDPRPLDQSDAHYLGKSDMRRHRDFTANGALEKLTDQPLMKSRRKHSGYIFAIK